MSHMALISKLGGGTAVANWLSAETGTPVKRDIVYKWQKNDVPPKWRAPVAKMAKQKQVKLPEGFLSWEQLQ